MGAALALRPREPARPSASVAERRRHDRVELWGLADVTVAGDRPTRHLVANLSPRGALLVGAPAAAPDAELAIVLRLPRRRPLSLRATVAWTRQETAQTRPQLGVAFRHLSREAEAAVQDALVDVLARGLPARSVVVVDEVRGRREELGAQLRLFGLRALPAASDGAAL
jgi:hypothetical protein